MAAAVVLIAAVVLARYTSSYFFLFDDFALIHEVSRTSVSTLAATPVFAFYRPLVFLLAKIEFRAFGWDLPWGYAAATALWHCANTCLVGSIARNLGATRLGAFAAAAVFFLSPWSAESYFWASARFDLLSAFGVLLSVLCGLSLDRAPGYLRKAEWFVLGCAGALVALFAKENAAMLPVLMVVVVGGFRPGAMRRRWLQWYFLTSVGAVCLYLWLRQGVLPGLAGAYGDAPALFARANLPDNAGSFLRAFVTFPSYYASLGHWAPLSIVALLVSSYFVLFLSVASRGWRFVATGVLAFLISLAPVASFAMLPGSSAAGRVLYLPAAWVCVLVGAAVGAAGERDGASTFRAWRARAAHVGFVVLLLVGLVSVVYQSRSWRAATIMSRSAIRQFARVLDRGVASVYIPNLPFWFAEGPYVLKPYAFGYYYGDDHSVPAVTAREMVVSAHSGLLQFAGWVDESAASVPKTHDQTVLELQVGVSNAPPSVVAPGSLSVFARLNGAPGTPGQVYLTVPAGVTWQAESDAPALYEINPTSGVGPAMLTVSPQRCTESIDRATTVPLHIGGIDTANGLIVRYRCVAGPGGPPFGFVDLPPEPVVPGTEPIVFQGWVLDDLDIRRVWLEAVDASGRRLALGEAARGGSRPDVAARSPDAYDVYNSAWVLSVPAQMLSSLGRPAFVVAFAEDGDWNRAELGRRTVR